MTADELQSLAELDRGPFGRCFSAVDPMDGRSLVVVRTDPAFSRSDRSGSINRLIDETRRLSRAHGDGLVQLRSFNVEGGSVEVVFEEPRGVTLDEWLGQGPHVRDEVIEVSRSLLAAFAKAHTLDVAHRNLSAHEVFVSPDRRVTVTGFGLTRTATRPAESSTPEVTAGEPATMVTDQFHLGRLLHRIARAARPPLDITDVCDRASSLRPEHRFADLFDLAAAFEDSVQLQASTHHEQDDGTPRVRRRRPRSVAGMVAALFVVAAAPVIFMLRAAILPNAENRPTADPVAVHQAVDSDGSNPLRRAERLIDAGELERAVPLLEAALSEDPLNEPAVVHASLGTIHLKLGNPGDAIDHLGAAVELDPRAENYYLLTLALASAGRTDEARAAAEMGLGIDPKHAELIAARTHLGG